MKNDFRADFGPFDGRVWLNRARNSEVHRQLREAGIDAAFRKGRLRFSPHLHNTGADIDRALAVLDRFGSTVSRRPGAPKWRALGVDGCRAGWLAVLVEGRRAVDFRVCQSFSEVLDRFPRIPVMVDVPIGLVESGPAGRDCDVQARKRLGFPRASSVFPPPARAALSASSFLEAADANQAATGKRITIQTWGILPKIREVDELLRAGAGAARRVCEVHPELCFWALNGRVAMRSNKKSKEGRRERRVLLERWCVNAGGFLDAAGSGLKRSDAGIDDLHDALVAALTGVIGFDTLPDKPETDARGLPMQMCFPVP